MCQTYCTQTYVLAAKKSQCTGINKKQIMSDVMAMQMKNTENACKEYKQVLSNPDAAMVKATNTHQALIFERVVDAPEEQPERPQVLEAKLEEVVRENHKEP